jgi:hypothetical protein
MGAGFVRAMGDLTVADGPDGVGGGATTAKFVIGIDLAAVTEGAFGSCGEVEGRPVWRVAAMGAQLSDASG